MEPEHVVQEQVDALNDRDLECLVGRYSPDVLVTAGTDTVVYQGQDAVRAGFGQLFENSPDVHLDVRCRITVGSWVIDEVRGTGFNFPGVPPELHEAVVYRVEDGNIVRCLYLD